ncbi:thiol reductant ABC exporter subunit CydD [Aquisalimonas sp.]|uniref:thiol reductant ABC exporter subunit CydD n=1 Tax=unclassified Aquisalimonas TaxID=2644645 RepID=UPI0025BA5B7A|nr:thiol reductant ABC exporter subunit CydD [Aquisalimonas sp.]
MTATPPNSRDAAKADKQWLAARAALAGAPRRVSTLAGTIGGWLVIPQAGLIAWLVHEVTAAGAGLGEVAGLLAALLLTFLARAGCTAAQEWAAADAACRVHERTRREVVSHLFQLGPSGLARHPTGGLASAAIDQISALGPYVSRYQPQLIITVAVPVVLLATVFALDWLAGLLLFLAAPLIPAFMAIVGMGADAVSRSQHQALARLGGHFLDRLHGLDLLRHMGRAEAEADHLARVGDDYRRRTMAVLRIAFLSSAVLEFFSSVAIAMVAVYVGMGLLGYISFGPAPELTLFSGLFVLLLAPEFFQPLRQLAQHYHDRAAALGAAAELRALTDIRSPMPVAGSTPPPTAPPEFVLHGVTVVGDGGEHMLKPVNLTINPGETVVLTGPSGVGKSTLLHAIAGFRRIEDGVLTVNGTPLERIDLSAWQGQLGWLAQVPHLFPGTLRENLLLDETSAEDEPRIRDALHRAGLERVLAHLPDGLETRVGEHGSGISGGEGQRVALARALLRQAPVLLVDEPTASLDPDTTAIITDALRGESERGATIIVATHTPDDYPWAHQVIALTRNGSRADG